MFIFLLFLIILRSDITVAAVFFTNSTSQNYIFGKRFEYGCVTSQDSK